MATPFERREWSGNAVPTTITSGIGTGATSITVADATGWPTGSTGPFIVTLDRGQATEEKIQVATRTGNVLDPVERGVDDTSAATHDSGATAEHTMSARDLDEANQHIADTGLDHHTQYFNTARHDAHEHTADVLEAAQRWEPGDLKWSARSTPTAGWLLCDGAEINRTTYADLFAAISTDYGIGDGSTTFNVPDFRDSFVMAEGPTNSRGDTGGSKDAIVVSHTHTQDAHGHTQNAHNHTGSSGNESAHTHGDGSLSAASTGAHTHTVPVETRLDTSHQHTGTTRIAGGPAVVDGSGNETSSSSGSHSHTVTGTTAAGSSHSHSVTVNNATATNQTTVATNQSTGSSGTDANLPPFGVANCFIKT